mgnify:CR=1 FL=1|tara:strand:+ start:374 stop:1207 length:834 start_codon:yes stop_codon:yes gene_type:complete
MIIGVIGLGFVGGSMYKSFNIKGLQKNINLFGYDKYSKNISENELQDLLKCDIIFTALPTKYNSKLGEYDKESTIKTCDFLQNNLYDGLIVIKSTVEPETTDKLYEKFKNLNFVHNPEFLTARTAFEDFHNQKHIVLGKQNNCDNVKFEKLIKFYKEYFPDAEISICNCLESESMKSFVNCFYSVKIQFFTEIQQLCEKNGCNYDLVKNMMIKNGWINKMHTDIPGPDGKISYGGLCFPKDTNALLKYMEKYDSPNEVLKSTILERNTMRNDNDNLI